MSLSEILAALPAGVTVSFKCEPFLVAVTAARLEPDGMSRKETAYADIDEVRVPRFDMLAAVTARLVDKLNLDQS